MVRSLVQHIESWQSTPLPVEMGLVVLDVPEPQRAASLGVVVGANHHGLQWIHLTVRAEHMFSSNHRVNLSKATF